MSAQLRTVRLLDREPGKATETRQVEGVTVERGVPYQPKPTGPTPILRALEPGESFVWKGKINLTDIRQEFPSRQFAYRKLGLKQYRYWRLK